MKSRGGLHPYDLGVFFILRDSGKRWPLRSVSQVSGWQLTRCLAHAFGKPVADVARDIIERSRLLEEGEHGNGQRHDSAT